MAVAGKQSAERETESLLKSELARATLLATDGDPGEYLYAYVVHATLRGKLVSGLKISIHPDWLPQVGETEIDEHFAKQQAEDAIFAIKGILETAGMKVAEDGSLSGNLSDVTHALGTYFDACNPYDVKPLDPALSGAAIGR